MDNQTIWKNSAESMEINLPLSIFYICNGGSAVFIDIRGVFGRY